MGAREEKSKVGSVGATEFTLEPEIPAFARSRDKGLDGIGNDLRGFSRKSGPSKVFGLTNGLVRENGTQNRRATRF